MMKEKRSTELTMENTQLQSKMHILITIIKHIYEYVEEDDDDVVDDVEEAMKTEMPTNCRLLCDN